MSDAAANIEKATTQLADINAQAIALDAEIVNLEKEATALEAKARDLRAQRAFAKDKRSELSKAARELDAVLRHSTVQKNVEDAAASAFKAQTDAEATLQRLAEKEAKLDELIAKATAPSA